MSDDPRGPFDPTEPVPLAPSDPTAMLPTTPEPAGGRGAGPVAWVKGAPLWAKISAPVAAVLVIAGIAGAGGSNKKTAFTASVTTAEASTESPTATEPSTTTEVPATVAPTTAPVTTAAPVTQPPATTSPSTAPPPTQGGLPSPGDTKNCSDFANYAQAKAWYDTYFPSYGDVARLDSDSDGIPCESLPGAP